MNSLGDIKRALTKDPIWPTNGCSERGFCEWRMNSGNYLHRTVSREQFTCLSELSNPEAWPSWNEGKMQKQPHWSGGWQHLVQVSFQAEKILQTLFQMNLCHLNVDRWWRHHGSFIKVPLTRKDSIKKVWGSAGNTTVWQFENIEGLKGRC